MTPLTCGLTVWVTWTERTAILPCFFFFGGGGVVVVPSQGPVPP